VFNFGNVIQNILAALLVIIEPGFQKIREETDFQNKKEEDQFDDNDHPEASANRHFPEPIVIKPEDLPHNDVQTTNTATSLQA
jgi:hypothetical protein